MPTAAGKGPLGKLTGRGFFMYDKLVLDSFGQAPMVCVGGQQAMRLESTGEILLLTVEPGFTGIHSMTGPDTFAWTQTWIGEVDGGTGRFEYATGTFSMTLDGSGALPGVVNIYEGTIDIHLD